MAGRSRLVCQELPQPALGAQLRWPAGDAHLPEEVLLCGCWDHRGVYLASLGQSGELGGRHPGQVSPPWGNEPYPATGHLPVLGAGPAEPLACHQQLVEVAGASPDGVDDTPLPGLDHLEQVHRRIVLALEEHGPLDPRPPAVLAPAVRSFLQDALLEQFVTPGVEQVGPLQLAKPQEVIQRWLPADPLAGDHHELDVVGPWLLPPDAAGDLDAHTGGGQQVHQGTCHPPGALQWHTLVTLHVARSPLPHAGVSYGAVAPG